MNEQTKKTDCECEMARYCDRHRMKKTQRDWELCREKEKWYQYFESKVSTRVEPEHSKTETLEEVFDPDTIDSIVGIYSMHGGDQLEISMRAAERDGWDVIAMAQWNVDLTYYTASHRYSMSALERKTEYELWKSVLEKCVAAKRKVDLIATLDDSIEIYRGSFDYLSVDLWPSKDVGVVLLEQLSKEKQPQSNPIIIDADNLSLHQATVMLFPPHVADKMVKKMPAIYGGTPGEYVSDYLNNNNLTAKLMAPGLCAAMEAAKTKYEPDDRFTADGTKRTKREKKQEKLPK